jgi:predicted carbohydrate-binding protein with CBM5 and CBM33 domain
MILSKTIGILSALIALSAFEAATGHGYMKTPRSRNYHANLNGKWSGGTASDPAPESCPHW